jgi:hydroxymethylglutaryl-CoA reductase (NADPH)
MTRGPVMRFSSALKAVEAKEWIENQQNFLLLKKAFDSTSRFARLDSIKSCIASRYLYIRFVSTTGDAMGMNMLSKVNIKIKLIFSCFSS